MKSSVILRGDFFFLLSFMCPLSFLLPSVVTIVVIGF